MNNFSDKRVVVTGIGTINPLGNNVEEYWDKLANGVSGIRTCQHSDLSDYHINIAGEVDFPNLTPYFSKRKYIKRFDRFILHTGVAGYEAIKSSGLADKVNDNPFRYGALIATGIAGLKSMMENCKQMFNKGLSSTSPFWITNVIPNSASALLTQEYNLQGPSFSTASACASSNHAFGIAINIIKSGVSDAILTGGSESISNRIGISAFGNIFALSKRVDDPTRASRPFDKDRDGFVIGEGSGVLCLEDLEHAKARGAKIYCEITGFGFTTDAYDLVAPHPEARGSSKAMEMAIENAKLNKEDIDLINCHGTSTPMGDFIEALAIHKVFGENAKNIPVHSSKSMIGHLIGASGAAEAIADIQTFEKGIIHPSINVVEQDTRIKLNVVKEAHEQKNVNHILSNSFGFGGHNACVVFSRFKD